MKIEAIQSSGLAQPLGLDKTKTVTNSEGPSFSEILAANLAKVDELQKQSDAARMQLLTGQAPDLHTVMIIGEKANLALQLTVQIRNKVIEAYQEIMRMQV
ncbi:MULTISPECIES: flagellar hook-basal body complex protein FliE [Carboxydocella]|uniref:Flagellar hook-basal body complex protein FliE n=2 Tax=Carboxydocella TaxID=178898 RepID=A0A1T4PAZ0_9FIRM|nr:MULTISPECIES: flagellar hook-basal body complex protein FliE [Carboxydocella]AVX20776.1 flagellar hook-basal body complex protein FliE [Carboxydocella thermautotrophica]AVX31195.1 flagellar hook-basal body complex protein FliE [Carboxydocella thermautotrophica]SJZ88710.1 flagellar hook-basal body complex protein FliE [Carboxydocella sporoproducens DSM 16521]GAW28305.1 flagellar hook-basal body protein FliE [Carboxydocella sp. ULO1]GAW32124.1 flagellar hook-basal body protein FliE [Carboxydo